LVRSFSNDHFHQENNGFKILRAHSEWGPKYSNFKAFTVYLMCSQFKWILADLFFLFSLWLDRAHWVLQEKLCFSPPTFKKHYFRKSVRYYDFSNIRGNRSRILIFVKYVLRVWNIVFLVELVELYPAITKKEKTNRLKFWIVSTLDTR